MPTTDSPFFLHGSNYLLESDIRHVFDQYDRDGNGYLGAADLASVYKSLGENLDDDLVSESCLRCGF